MRRLLVGLLMLGLGLPACGNADSGSSADATYEARSATARASSGSPVASPTQAASPPVSPTAAGSPAATPTPAASATRAATTPTPSPTATLVPLQPVTLTGSGTALSERASLPAGFVVVTLRHAGAGRFAVTLFDDGGANLGQLASGESPYLGSRALLLPDDGAYVFEVSAGGAWQIDVARPEPTAFPVSDLPFEQSGSGSQALYFVRAEPGLHRLEAGFDGAGPFVVTVLSHDGELADRVINASGPFDGSGAITVRGEEDAFLVIDIRASGDWTVSVD